MTQEDYANLPNLDLVERYVLVKFEKDEEKVKNGIIIPQRIRKEKEVVKKATVLMISPEVSNYIKKDQEDPEATLSYRVGDKILMHGKIPIFYETEEYAFIKYDGIIAVERPKKEN